MMVVSESFWEASQLEAARLGLVTPPTPTHTPQAEAHLTAATRQECLQPRLLSEELSTFSRLPGHKRRKLHVKKR